MRLKYTLEMVDMGSEVIAVPVGDGANKLHGVLKLNNEGQEIVALFSNDISIEGVVDALRKKYDNNPEEIREYVLSITDILIKNGLLEN